MAVKQKEGSRHWGFNRNYLDTSIRPQDDFFHFAVGEWLKKNPIPAAESRWGSFYVIRDKVQKQKRVLLKELIRKKNVAPGSEMQIVRDFYRSGMDMTTRNRLGATPIAPLLKKIENIQTHNDLLAFITHSHRYGLPVLWEPFVAQDEKNSEAYIAYVAQSGISLPDRDYYLKQDGKSKEIRQAFLAHMEATFKLLGENNRNAASHARQVLRLETQLARASMDKESCRNVERIYNKKTVRALARIAPTVNWSTYLNTIGLKGAEELIVMQPAFIKRVNELLTEIPLETWKVYLRFTVADEAAPFLSEKFVSQHFQFYGKALSGSKKMRPRWKRVLSVLDSYVGDAVGKEYVKRYFPPEAKEKINELVDDLFAAYAARIEDVDWMSEKTKKKALTKLSHMTRKLGYPDKWKSYRGLRIKPDTYFENALRASEYERKREFKRLGKKVDRKKWFIPPQTVNAFYDPNMNEIVFPAGILQPPFFDPRADDAINYGAIGSIIGHEITHGFDDEGSKFDEGGNFKNWWTKEDRKRFEQKTKTLIRQFNQYPTVDGLTVNGKFTVGENIADLGGAAIAYDAHQRHLAHTEGKTTAGFTPKQRFFLGLARVECGHMRPEAERLMVFTDPHAPFRYRVNGPVSNLSEFHEAFNVREGDALYRPAGSRVKVW